MSGGERAHASADPQIPSHHPRRRDMRDLTIHELDAQLAEQLPARELMGCWRSYSSSFTSVHTTAINGNNGNENYGFANDIGSGDLDFQSVNVSVG